MKHNLLKGYSILSYFVALFGGFFIGLAVAAITEAGKGQMLAGGAIVLFYGIIGSFIALCLAFIIAYKADRKVIIGINIFYTLAIVSTFILLRHNKQKRDKERERIQQQYEEKQNKVPTTQTLAHLNNDFQSVGNGWIRWMQNGKLIISYSLLS